MQNKKAYMDSQNATNYISEEEAYNDILLPKSYPAFEASLKML